MHREGSVINRILALALAAAFVLLAWVLWLGDGCSCPDPPAPTSTTTTERPPASSSEPAASSSSSSSPPSTAPPASPVPGNGGLTG